jgi:hypothetical protein
MPYSLLIFEINGLKQMGKKFIPVILFVGFSMWALMSHSILFGDIPGMGCFKDFNGNGILDAGEYGECAATPQGYLCALGSDQDNTLKPMKILFKNSPI